MNALWCRVQISKKLACGDVGNGALAEPQAIAEAVRGAVCSPNPTSQADALPLNGLHVGDGACDSR